MAGPYLFVSPSLNPCPTVCLLPLFHLCCHFSIHSPSSRPLTAFSPPLTFWCFLPQLLFVCLPPLFSSCPLTFLLCLFTPPFFSWPVLLPFQLSFPFSMFFPLIWTPFSPPSTSPLPQLSSCCLFLLPQVSDTQAISFPLCFSHPHPAPHSRLLLMIKAKTSHQ